jgi:hypothetical protein
MRIDAIRNFISTPRIDRIDFSDSSSDQEEHVSSGQSLTDIFDKDRFISSTPKEAIRLFANQSEGTFRNPTLEKPTSSSFSSPLVTNGLRSTPLDKKETAKIMSIMSEESIEQIMIVILKYQFEVEKNNLKAVESSLQKFEQLKDLQSKMLLEMKEVLLKDQQVLNYVKTGETITGIATVICSAAALAVNILPDNTVPGTLAAICFGSLYWLGTVGPWATGLSYGIAKGTKIYFSEKEKQQQAAYTNMDYHDKCYQKYSEQAHENLTGVMDAYVAFQKRLSLVLKTLENIHRLTVPKKP